MIAEKGIEHFSTQNNKASRKLGGVVVERHNELNYTHYALTGSSAEPIEIYLADELKMAGLPFRRLKEFVISELERVESDPFGETCIDPHVSNPEAQSKRAVNHLREGIQAAITLPVAVKTSFESQDDPDVRKEDLIDQFLYMRELQLVSQERLSNKQKTILEFLSVYGAVRVGSQEFLIMRYIAGATETEDIVVPYQTYGWPGSGDPDSEYALRASGHRDLLEAIGFKLPPEILRYRYIAGMLSGILGMPLYDLAGRNLLYYSEGESRKYVIIDQVRHKFG